MLKGLFRHPERKVRETSALLRDGTYHKKAEYPRKFTRTLLLTRSANLSVPKYCGRRKVAAFSTCKLQQLCGKSLRRSWKESQHFWGCGIEIAVSPRFQNRSAFGTRRVNCQWDTHI